MKKVCDFINKGAIYDFLFSYGVAIMLFVLSQYLFDYVKDCNHASLWKWLLFGIVIVLCFFYYVWRSYKKKETQNSISTAPLVEKYNIIRKYIEKNKFNRSHNDAGKFSEALGYLCRNIYEALSNVIKDAGYTCYGINVLLLSGNEEIMQGPEDLSLELVSAGGDDRLITIYRSFFNDNHKNNPQSCKLSENMPYFSSYCNYKDDKSNLIVITTNIRNKLKNGNHGFKSALIGNWEFPYDSSIVVPILPLVNDNGNAKIEGFFNVISGSTAPFINTSKDELSDEQEAFVLSDEYKAFLEAMSGCLYEVCHNYQKTT